MLRNISGFALYGNNYKNPYSDMPIIGVKEEDALLAQSAPVKNLAISTLLAKWVQLRSSAQESTPSEIKEEFELIRQFCQENGKITTSKHPNPFLKNYDMKIMFTESQPEIGKPEKYTIFVRKIIPIKEGGEIKKRYLLESTTTYEHYPANNNENERVTKIYTQEIYKKDPKTGAYITDRDELTKLPKILTKSRTIEIKDGKTSEVTEDQDEDAILEKYMEEKGLDDGAKGRKRDKSRRVRKRLKINLEDKFKKDYFVRWGGFPMRNTTAQKMSSIRKTVQSCNPAEKTYENKERKTIIKVEYDIQVTCTTGGSHVVWQHKSGYAVDYVITKRVITSVRDKKTGEKKVTTGFKYLRRGDKKNTQTNAELRKVINAILASEEKNLYNKDEYFGTSKLKRGDHMHAHIIDPDAEIAARYPAGTKSVDMAAQDVQEAFSLMNGYMPGELK